MNVHISYKADKSPEVEQEFSHQIRKLEKRVQVFRPDLVHLYGTVEQSAPRKGSEVSLNLRLPSGQMAAMERNHSPVAAVKAAFADLLEQLGKHKDLLRSKHKMPRRRRDAAAVPKGGVPFEKSLAAVHPPTISEGDIASYVNANLENLTRFIEREIRYRENIGQLRADLLSTEEVLDEVIATALDNGEHRPEVLSLERWLYRLALRSIPRLAVEAGEAFEPVPLEKSARVPNIRASDEPHLQYHQPDEAMLEEEVIPDRRVSTPEEIAASDEMIDLVEAALVGAPPSERQAFILYAVEGFSIRDIAATTDRPPAQVRAAIEAARERLQKHLPVANPFKEKLLQHSRIA